MKRAPNKNKKQVTKDKSYLSFVVIGAIFLSAFAPNLADYTKASASFVKDILHVETNEAQAAQGGPSALQWGVRDLGCSQQERTYGNANLTSAPGMDYGYVTDENGKDPDCAAINLVAGNTTLSNGAMYTNDFRIGIALAESENGCTDRRSSVSWTGWASEGGGTTTNYAAGSINAADCIWVYYETRAIPNGSVRITDAQVGIGVGGGAMRFTPWASQGGGWSAWSSTSNDFTVARISLNSRLNYKYNSDYTSTTIPQYPPNRLTLNQTGSYSITMRNIPDVGQTTAMPWTSDVELPGSTTNRGVAHCYDWTPTSASETCTQTTSYTSSKFKLRRIDGNGASVSTTGGDWSYTRTVVSQWGAAQVWYEGQCYFGAIDDNRSFAEKLFNIKKANAQPIDPGDGGETCDPPYPSNPPVYNAVYQSQDQSNDVQLNDTVTFSGINTTALANGSFQLQFQMVNTDTNELFGDANAPGNSNTIARINVATGSFSFNCTATVSTVVGQVANYAVNLGGTPSGTINVTLTTPGTPPPTMTNSPLQLTAANSYSGIANLSTAGMSPGTYNIAFTASNGSESVPCPAELQLTGGTQATPGTTNLAIYHSPSVQFTINGGSSANISTIQTAKLSWITTATNSGTDCIASNGWGGNKGSNPASPYEENVGPFPAGNYTFSLVCNGALGSQSTTMSVALTVTPPPTTPGIPTTNGSAQCGAIDVNWTYSTPPTVDGFEVWYTYNSTNKATAVRISPAIGAPGYLDGNARTFRHLSTNATPPAAAYNRYYIKVFNGGLSAESELSDPVSLITCSVNVSTSDKDVTLLQRGNSQISSTTGAPSACNWPNVDIFKLPNAANFRTGDIVTMRICISNTGTQTLSGVSVEDTMTNLSEASNFSFTPSNCGSGGSSGTSFNFDLADLAPNQSCTIAYKAKVTAPAGATTGLYRFQNYARLYADQITGGSYPVDKNGTSYHPIYTPTYPFTIGAGIPIRNETNK